jgi:hypothetical protein
MATIIELGLWTVTKEAAELMAEEGFIKECKADHEHQDLLAIDKPIYHVSPEAPDWFGYTTIAGSIRLANEEVERRKTA